jgi:hypothetical protein
MAAFMKRLAENQVVDAATLDGLDSTELVPTLYAQGDADNGGTTVAATGRVTINSIPIDVPVDGVLVASGSVFINNQSGAQRQFVLNLLVDGANALAQDWAAVTSFETATEQNRGNFDYTVAIAVSAGAHTITQQAGPYAGVANFFYNQETLNLVFYPNAVSSLVLSSTDSGGDPQGN